MRFAKIRSRAGRAEEVVTSGTAGIRNCVWWSYSDPVANCEAAGTRIRSCDEHCHQRPSSADLRYELAQVAGWDHQFSPAARMRSDGGFLASTRNVRRQGNRLVNRQGEKMEGRLSGTPHRIVNNNPGKESRMTLASTHSLGAPPLGGSHWLRSRTGSSLVFGRLRWSSRWEELSLTSSGVCPVFCGGAWLI